MMSIRAFIIRQVSKQVMKRSRLASNPLGARRDFDRRMTKLPIARGVSCSRENVGGIECEWLVPDGCENAPLIYFLHGGACVLLSPWLDLAGEGDSHHTRSRYDPWFRPEKMPELVANFCAETELREPLVSPIHADAGGLPPTLIQVGDHEILLSDSTQFADNIKATGGRVDLHIWPDMWHVFQYFIGHMPESRKAIDDIGRFLRSEFATDRIDLQKSQAA